MSIPYHPDTDAVPDMTDHRVADLRARLAAAEAREARLVGAADALAKAAVNEDDDQPCQFCDGRWFPGEKPAHTQHCPVGEVTRALTTDGSALAQAIEGVLASPGLRTDAAPDVSGKALVDEIVRLMTDLIARVEVLRRAWGQR